MAAWLYKARDKGCYGFVREAVLLGKALRQNLYSMQVCFSHDLSGASSIVVMREVRPRPGRREGVLSDVEG